MEWKQEYKSFLWIAGFFVFAYYMPIEESGFRTALLEAFSLAKWYAQEHVLLCLVPAFFIAGSIAVFISQASVIKYLGAKAKKWVAYLVASLSGGILAVCSCTVLPLFAGIHKRGAGLGPAITFLYAGPAVNILAMILTARVLGLELGIARIIGAVVFSIVIGIIMSFIYRKEEAKKTEAQLAMPEPEEARPLWQTSIHFFILIGILIFATFGQSGSENGIWNAIYQSKWWLVTFFGVLLAGSLVYILKINKIAVAGAFIIVASVAFIFESPLISFLTGIALLTVLLTFHEGEPNDWLSETWDFTKQIMPLLAIGVLIAGFLLGAPGGDGGIIPNEWIASLVGGNSLFSNFFASIVGAFMYFATLTEIPILQGLIHGGMGKGPALALLLAGPALSLPNMLVIRSILGTQKTVVYVSLVVVMSTLCGILYGFLM